MKERSFVLGIISGMVVVFVYTFSNSTMGPFSSVGPFKSFFQPVGKPWWLILPLIPGLAGIIAGYLSKGILKGMLAGLLIAILGALSAVIILDQLLSLFVKIDDDIPYSFADTIAGALEYMALLAIFTVPAGFIGGLINWLQRELFDRKKGLLT